MKKMNLTKLMAVLVVLCLITSTFVGSTLAKYITADDAADSARVAKFGVIVKADGSLFEDSYIDAPEANATTATVTTSGAIDGVSNLVAPGTESADTFKFSIEGQPEVDVKVSVVVTEDNNDIFLKAGTYADMTTGVENDEFTFAEDYYPVKYTLTKQGNPVVTDVNLADLKTALQAISVAKVEANTNLATEFGEYEITWKWDFEGTGTEDEKKLVDQKDTVLGDLMASKYAPVEGGATLTAGTDYNLKTGFKVAITVEQID